MNELQLFMLMQNQVLEIRTGMMLTRVIPKFRTSFKAMVGLPKRASNLDVLIAIGCIYKNNGKLETFMDYVNKTHNHHNGQPLVTEKMISDMQGE